MKTQRFLMILGFWWLGALGNVFGHSVFQNKLRLEHSPTELRAEIAVSAKEICSAAGILISEDGSVEQAAVEDAAGRHPDYLLKHFQIQVDGTPWQPQLMEIVPPLTWDVPVTNVAPEVPGQVLEGSKRDRPDRIMFKFRFRHVCISPPEQLTLSHDMMKEFQYNDGQQFNFSYVYTLNEIDGPANAGLGQVLSGQSLTITLRDKQTWGQRFVAFLKIGVHHVLVGYDHLLFAAALVLAVRRFRSLMLIVGIFTLAHSISITLAAYGWLRLPETFPKEPLIAGSILVVALENIFFAGKEFNRRRLFFVFIFGLIHGLGFAEIYTESMSGLETSLIAVALIAFCLGVELGHLCIVAPLSALIGLGTAKLGEKFSRKAQFWGSLLVGLGGAYFLLASLGWLPANLMPDVLLGAG